MAYLNTFKIEVYIDNCRWSKLINSTQDEVAVEAMDYMNELIFKYFDDNRITSQEEQEYIIANAYHAITWEENDPLCMYAVYLNDTATDEPMIGVYYSRADAEEAILSECEAWVERVMMTCDPYDILGEDEWRWHNHYYYLLRDCGYDYSIQTVPVYNLDED